MTTAPPPPPPRRNDPTPPAPATEDPTPVLSAIGQLNAPSWGDERNRLVRLQAIAVAWNFQSFMVLAIAAAMPWLLGRSGVPWTILLLLTALASGLMQTRFIRKRSIAVSTAKTEVNRNQVLVRLVLYQVLMMTLIFGVLLALAPGFPTEVAIITMVAALAFIVIIMVLVGRRSASTHSRPQTNSDLPPPEAPHR